MLYILSCVSVCCVAFTIAIPKATVLPNRRLTGIAIHTSKSALPGICQWLAIAIVRPRFNVLHHRYRVVIGFYKKHETLDSDSLQLHLDSVSGL